MTSDDARARRGDGVPDDAWRRVLERRLGTPVRVLDRAPLSGGYVAASVEKLVLDVDGRERTVVLKAAGPVEVAAMRAVAVVAGPAAGAGDRPGWLVLPFVDAPALGAAEPVPEPVWRTLAAVHAHWLGKRPRGIPVVDAAWWAALCDRTLVAVRGGLARTGEREFADCRVGAAGLAGRPGDHRLPGPPAPHARPRRRPPRQRPGRHPDRLGQRPRRPRGARPGDAAGPGRRPAAVVRGAARAATGPTCTSTSSTSASPPTTSAPPGSGR